MKKITVVVMAAALSMVSAPGLISIARAASMPSTIVAQDHSIRASKLIGMEVFNGKGDKIGTVEDVLVRSSASEPLVVLSVGGFVGVDSKMVAVPLSHVSLRDDKASMQATKAQVMAMHDWRFNGLNGGGG